MRFYRIGNEQAPHDHFVMVVVAFAMVVVGFIGVIVAFAMMVVGFIRVIVMHIDHGELDGIDAITKCDYPGLVCTGVVQEILQPVGLQAETDSQHKIGVSYPGNVACAWQKVVRIAAHRKQAEDLHPASTYHSGPIGHEVGGCHHLDRCAGGRGLLA